MNGTMVIGLESINKLSDVQLIRSTKKLSDIFLKYFPNIKIGTNYKEIEQIFTYKYQYDIIIYFYKSDIIKNYKKYNNLYNNHLYKIFSEYYNYQKQNGIEAICLKA